MRYLCAFGALLLWEFCCTSRKFKINRWLYIIPVVISFLLWLPMKNCLIFSITNFIFSYLWVINASIYDIKYREIDPALYVSLLVSAFSVFPWESINGYELVNRLISLAVTYGFMWLYFKIGERLNESVGGADIKIILLLSLMYPFELSFMFLFSVFAATIVLTIIHTIIHKDKTSVPMVCSIAFAHIAFSYIYIIIPGLRT